MKELDAFRNFLKEAYNPFLDTEEGGYMREYIDDVAKTESLSLKHRPDFNIAFDLALTKLKEDYPEEDYPELDFAAIEANKESFF